MKKTLIQACVLVLMVFSISTLLQDPSAKMQPVLHEVVIIAIEVPMAEQVQNKSIPRIEVVKDAILKVEEVDIFCLAKNIFHEAGIEADIGKYAVAQITLNRLNSPKYPSTICKVVLDRYQFSWANQRSKHWTRPKGANWDRSYAIAQQVIHENYRVKGLENARYYHADYVNPHWTRDMTQVATLGKHIFYTNDVIY
jgi:spore germination cell wall hydrolase CwlJ-like protein